MKSRFVPSKVLRRLRHPAALLSSLLLAFAVPATAEPFDVKAHYDKQEIAIAMRDGIKLHTVIYTPRDTSRRYPILLVRTPYSAGPYGPEQYIAPEKMAPSDDFLRDGYIFVFQDGRGTFKSEGAWINLHPRRTTPDGTDESTDAWDSIDWLVKHLPGNNGRVGQWGISHPGWYTVQSMAEPHPALKAASPQATTYDPFIGDDEHRNGAFGLASVEWWYLMSQVSGPDRAKLGNDNPPHEIDFGTPWDYQFFLNAGPTDQLNENHYGGKLGQIWQNMFEHPDYDGFWVKINVHDRLGKIGVPVLNVMGWFDSPDPYGAMATYQDIERQNPGNRSTLVAGPWKHGGWRRDDGSKLGDIRFGSKTSEYFQKDVIFPFFQYYLKDQGTWNPTEAIVFETGANRWHHLPQWPPRQAAARNLYFHADGKLAFDPPGQAGDAHDEYLSDPARPVPYTSEIRREAGAEYMVGDQRYAWARPDVLSYQTDVLEDDITIAGAIPVELFASTTGTDSDWFVKLIDVYPHDAPDNADDPKGVKMGNYQMLVGIEVMRGKYRDSYSHPAPMVPDRVTRIGFDIRDKFHTFKKGHRIMVQVQSSWFPVVDRNPQTFTDIYTARPADYRKATQKVYRSAASPTHLVLPVVQGTLD